MMVYIIISGGQLKNGELNFSNQTPSGLIQPPIVYEEETLVWESKQLIRNLAKEKNRIKIRNYSVIHQKTK